MNPRFKPFEEGKWERWDRKNNSEQCCDCLAVHRVDYRIVKKGKQLIIESRIRRDDKATNAARKRAGIKILVRK